MSADSGVLKLAQILPSISYQSGEGSREIRSFKPETYKDFLDAESLKFRLDEIVASRPDAQQIRDDFLAAVEAGKTARF